MIILASLSLVYGSGPAYTGDKPSGIYPDRSTVLKVLRLKIGDNENSVNFAYAFLDIIPYLIIYKELKNGF